MFKRLVRNLMYFFSLLHIPYFLARTYFLFPAAFFCPRVNLWRITSSGTAKSASREHIIILQYPIELKYQNKNFHTVISIFWQKKVFWSEICGFWWTLEAFLSERITLLQSDKNVLQVQSE